MVNVDGKLLIIRLKVLNLIRTNIQIDKNKKGVVKQKRSFVALLLRTKSPPNIRYQQQSKNKLNLQL